MTSREPLRALSIRQPWAGLILAGIKSIENRTWTTRYRGLVVIHAGASDDQNAPLGVRRAAALIPGSRHRGFVGIAVLADVHPDTGCCRPWGEPDTHHWLLTNPVPFTEPIAGRGRLGLFRELPADVITAAVRLVEGS